VNAEKWGTKLKKGGGVANLLLSNFYALRALFPQLSVFAKLCIMNTLVHFLLCQSCRVSEGIQGCRNGSALRGHHPPALWKGGNGGTGALI